MKRLLLALPFALAACSGDTSSRLMAPSDAVASRSGEDGTGGEGSGNRVVVSPQNMRGWAFYDDNTDGPCLVVANCRMVRGPGNPPLGVGSAELAANVPTDRYYLGLYRTYNGTPFRLVTALSYWTYRQSPPDPVDPLAISLQFNVDYDLSDANRAYQGRVVFEPYLTAPGAVTSLVWQRWNALTGRGWWSSNLIAAAAANPTAVPCTQATPCTWSELVAKYPRAGVHQVFGAVLLKAGGGWALFRGNTDALTIGVAGFTRTYDFEPAGRGRGGDGGQGDDQDGDHNDDHSGDHGGA